ncbi:hypothetical protein AB0M05_43845 [Streptomyces violaceusniger]|uniref:hypothetical protein n=1 Tax=Streptomyces violaceusniger TaxID=68280 RepID=UPI00344195E5
MDEEFLTPDRQAKLSEAYHRLGQALDACAVKKGRNAALESQLPFPLDDARVSALREVSESERLAREMHENTVNSYKGVRRRRQDTEVAYHGGRASEIDLRRVDAEFVIAFEAIVKTGHRHVAAMEAHENMRSRLLESVRQQLERRGWRPQPDSGRRPVPAAIGARQPQSQRRTSRFAQP